MPAAHRNRNRLPQDPLHAIPLDHFRGERPIPTLASNRSTHERVLDRRYAGLVGWLLIVSRDGGEGLAEKNACQCLQRIATETAFHKTLYMPSRLTTSEAEVRRLGRLVVDCEPRWRRGSLPSCRARDVHTVCRSVRVVSAQDVEAVTRSLPAPALVRLLALSY
jgi:hypothetical protein